MTQTTLAQRLTHVMTQYSISDNELARRLTQKRGQTVYPSAVGAWRRGVEPDGKNLILLPKALGVSADWLFLDEGPMNKPPRDALEAAWDVIVRAVYSVTEASRPQATPEEVLESARVVADVELVEAGHQLLAAKGRKRPSKKPDGAPAGGKAPGPQVPPAPRARRRRQK